MNQVTDTDTKMKPRNGEIKEHMLELDKRAVHFSILQRCYCYQESEFYYLCVPFSMLVIYT